MSPGRVLGWGFHGIVLLALYRLTGWMGRLLMDEIGQIVGQSMKLATPCMIVGLIFFGALAEAYFWLRDRIG